jgi:hypothetical protein
MKAQFISLGSGPMDWGSTLPVLERSQ